MSSQVEAEDGGPAHLGAIWLRPHDIPTMLDIHRRTVAAMPDPSLVRAEDEESFAAAFARGGAVGVTVDGALAGYGLVRGAGALPCDRLGLEGRVGVEDDLVILDGSAVAPQYRGQGVHRRLVAERLAIARTWGAAHVAATAAPRNAPSMSNLMRGGLVIVAHVTKSYGERYVLWRPMAGATMAAEPGELVPATDVAAARARLAERRVAFAVSADADGAPILAFTRHPV